MIEFDRKPGDQRNFVHKRLLGAVVGGVRGLAGGGISGAISGAGRGFVSSGGGATLPPPTTHAPVFTGIERGSGFGQPRRITQVAPPARTLAAACPNGMRRNRQGVCVKDFIPRIFDPFDVEGRVTGTRRGPMEDDDFGEAVIGAFNMPALVPATVGTIQRRDGSVGPILRCPRGSVLATDNLCYNKGIKGLAAHRKWKPGRPPFLPRRDLAALDRVAALKKSKTLKGRFKALGLC